MNNTISNQEKEEICMDTRKENMNMNRHVAFEIGNPPAPLHGALPHILPHHEREGHLLPPHVRGSLVSILYDIEVMKNIYGDNYTFRMDQLAPETPEMKILFALIMGFKINVNSNLVEALLYQRSMGVGIKFDNFTKSQLEVLSAKLGVEAEILSVILNPIPEGVAVVIMSMIKEG